jgi:aminopeptidase-like protein
MVLDDPRVELASGEELHQFAHSIFPICRSLTGEGVRQTLGLIKEVLPELTIHEVPSGTPAFDWRVPDEWNIRTAYIEDSSGRRIVDFAAHNLHVVGYSMPVNKMVSLGELQAHLHSLPHEPEAIPYVTSYYKRDWGFCVPHHLRENLKPDNYRIVIDSDLKPGSLTYGELIIPGQSRDEIFLSTYICHPSMANNEISGPVIATHLARWLSGSPRHYTYRVVFVPETIGAIVYLSRHLNHLKKFVAAGYVVTCCGDEGNFSYLSSRTGQTYADKVAIRVLSEHAPGFTRYSFLQRGSDERQYCSPLVDLPVASVMRSKYHEYPQYHSSADDLTFVTAHGLQGALHLYVEIVRTLEANRIVRASLAGEPQLGRRGLYPNTGGQIDQSTVNAVMDLLAYADGQSDIVDIAGITGHDVSHLRSLADTLSNQGLLTTGFSCD